MNLKKLYYLLFLLLIFGFLANAKAQDTTQIIGGKVLKQKINYYDFSDPSKINFEVTTWGGFKNPGKYLVPEGTTLIDLLTFTGFPPNSELLEEVKLLRVKNISEKYSSTSVSTFNFKKFFDKKTMDFSIANPYVKPGDIVIIPLEVEKTFWDYFKDAFVLVGPLASIISLIITINNSKN